MQLQEVIQRGNLNLRKLEEAQVRLKQKTMVIDAEIKKLETEIVQTRHIEEGQDKIRAAIPPH